MRVYWLLFNPQAPREADVYVCFSVYFLFGRSDIAMHCVVCMKQVPDSSEVRVDRKTNTLIREGVPAIINPYDIHAIEEALRIKDEFGGKVTVISLGPPQAAEAIKKAISYGVDEAILLSDSHFAGSDTLATSYILAQTIEKIQKKETVDLIICGKQAIDGDTAQVGPGISARLNIPLLTYVMKILSVDVEKKEIQIERKLEAEKEISKATLPALITVVKGINELRYASWPDMLRAARYQVPIWTVADLDLDLAQVGLKGSPTMVTKIFPPPLRQGGEIIDSAGKNAKEIAKMLVDKLVPHEIIANS